MKKRTLILRTVLMQFLIGGVVGLIQSSTLLRGLHSTTVNWPAALIIPIAGIPFNTGGFTTRFAFEALVEPLGSFVGHRSATVMSNLPFYLLLLLLQVAFVVLLVYARYRKTKTSKDWFIIVVFITVFINGLINIMWPWWGT